MVLCGELRLCRCQPPAGRANPGRARKSPFTGSQSAAAGHPRGPRPTPTPSTRSQGGSPSVRLPCPADTSRQLLLLTRRSAGAGSEAWVNQNTRAPAAYASTPHACTMHTHRGTHATVARGTTPTVAPRCPIARMRPDPARVAQRVCGVSDPPPRHHASPATVRPAALLVPPQRHARQ